MNLDDLRQGWQSHNHMLADEDFDRLAADVIRQSEKLEDAIVKRDWIEAGAAAFVVCFFAVFTWWNRSAFPVTSTMAFGIGLIMLSVVGAIAVMFRTRIQDARPDQNASIVEYSRAELIRLNRQIKLLSNVSWWYSGPMMLSCFIFFFGVVRMVPELPAWTSTWFLAGVALCLVWAMRIIGRANRKAVDSELIPLRQQIEECLAVVESPDVE